MKKTVIIAIFATLVTVGATVPAQAGNVRGGITVDLGILFPFHHQGYSNKQHYRPRHGHWRGNSRFQRPRHSYRHGYRSHWRGKHRYKRGYRDGYRDGYWKHRGRGHSRHHRWH